MADFTNLIPGALLCFEINPIMLNKNNEEIIAFSLFYEGGGI